MIRNFILQLQNNGLNIDTIYDIGAHLGSWSRSTKTYIPNANFYLFEANPAYQNFLNATGFKNYCGVALSDNSRTSVRFFNGCDTGDSYYKETTPHYDNQQGIDLQCTTLDSIVQNDSLPIPQLIKIDTQGSELDILSGASSFIDKVDVIYTECPIIRYNHGAPDIQDYIDFFKKRNFVPVELFEKHYAEGMLIQVDIMFMNHESKNKYHTETKTIRPFL